MNKGFTYIITTMLIIMLVSGVVMITKYNRKSSSNPVATLAKNYENEFLNILEKGASVENINQFNYKFKKFVNSNNYDARICNLITTEDGLIVSNYMDQNCELMIGDNQQTITENTTTIVDTDIFINDTNIYLCNCYYKAGENIYYIDIYNENSKIIFKN